MLIHEFVETCRALGAKLPRGAGRFFGQWVGRPMDGDLSVAKVSYGDHRLTIEFAGGERLELWNPAGLVATADRLAIATASKLVFTWHDHGRAKTPAHLHRLELAPPSDAPAFELLK
jgi:hypothetical protein